jgi:hypothetical protein
MVYNGGAIINPDQNPIHKQHLNNFAKLGNKEIILTRNDSKIEPYFMIKHIPIAAKK